MSGKKKLLYLSPVQPARGGSGLAMRALSVLHALLQHYRVYLLVIDPWSSNNQTLANIPEQVEILEVPSDIFANQQTTGQKFSPSEWPLLTIDQSDFMNELIKQYGFDRAHVFRLYMAPFVSSFLGRIPCALDLDELESQTRFRHAENCHHSGATQNAHAHIINGQFYKAAERVWLRKFDQIYVCSKQSKNELIRQHKKLQITILPNTIEIPSIKHTSLPPELFTILFVGNMGYYPNRDAVSFLNKQVVPEIRSQLKRDFEIRIVGSGKVSSAWIDSLQPEICWLGYVQDLNQVYQQCHIVVVPMRSGGGTRIKVLEAFAHSRPVVTTSIGVEGLAITPDIHCLVADSAAAIAQACVNLENNIQLRDGLVTASLQLVHKEYNQDRLTDILAPDS